MLTIFLMEMLNILKAQTTLVYTEFIISHSLALAPPRTYQLRTPMHRSLQSKGSD